MEKDSYDLDGQKGISFPISQTMLVFPLGSIRFPRLSGMVWFRKLPLLSLEVACPSHPTQVLGLLIAPTCLPRPMPSLDSAGLPHLLDRPLPGAPISVGVVSEVLQMDFISPLLKLRSTSRLFPWRMTIAKAVLV